MRRGSPKLEKVINLSKGNECITITENESPSKSIVPTKRRAQQLIYQGIITFLCLGLAYFILSFSSISQRSGRLNLRSFTPAPKQIKECK